jgi:hypothetical protein
MAKPGAIDNAQVEVAVEGQEIEFDQRVQANSQGLSGFDPNADTVQNAVINTLREQEQAGIITETLGLDTLASVKDPQKITEIVTGALQFTDARKMTLKQASAIYFFTVGGAALPTSAAAKFHEGLSFSQRELLRDDMNRDQELLMRDTVNGIIAAHDWNTPAEALADISVQELIPIQNVYTKILFQDLFFESFGTPKEGESIFLLGERRQEIREQIIALKPSERLAGMKELRDSIEKLQSDPTMGKIIRTFNVLENFEAIFTEGVLTGDDSSNSWDRFFGNFESIAESVFSVLVFLRVGGKSLKTVFRAGDANTLTKTARQTGARTYQAEAEKLIRGRVAREMGIEPDDMAAGRYPRPHDEFVDDRTIHLPGVDTATQRADRIAGEIMKAQLGRLGRVLNQADRSNTAQKELDRLDLGDQAVIAPAMSTITELDDGVRVKAVITKNGQEAYNSFDELLPDLLALDPNLETLTILRRGAEGKLVSVEMTPVEVARIATLRVEGLSDADLIARSSKATNQIEVNILEREAAKRAGTSPEGVTGILGDEFFLEFDHFRAYHPTDKLAFGEQAVRSTVIPFVALTPNAKFGDELVGAFQTNYNTQERVVRLFEDMFHPYYKLNVKDKKIVSQIYEWSEDWAKEVGRAPDLFDVTAEFGELTAKQYGGLVALRSGLDVQYEVFNRRLFLEFQGLGYRTARHTSPDFARYHGRILAQDEVTSQAVYDPISQEIRTLDAAERATVYNDGGSIMKLDVPVDVPGTNGGRRSTLILVDGDQYKVGELSTRPLEYYPGYNYRFYEDPYYITKSISGVEVDGVVKAATDTTVDAIKTAGSQLEAEQFLNRAFTRVVDDKGVVKWVDKEDPHISYNFERAQDISQEENVFKQKQTLQREGRLFWDQRARDRLTNVNGSTSAVMDFTKALERGTQLSARLNLEEDAMRAVKHAFANDFSDLLDAGDLAKKDMGTIIKQLRAGLTNATETTKKARFKRALEIAKYIRQMQGHSFDQAVPWLRRQVLRSAVWADRTLNGKGFKAGQFTGIEKWAQQMDPLRAARSTAFHLFMIFRPFRQALLQMSQPMFLAGIDPAYVISGKGLVDAFALRRGFIRLRNAAYENDGYSAKWAASRMGLGIKEYRLLVKNFDESGVLDIVDVHSFAGGARRWQKLSLPKDTLGSKAWYGVRATTSGAVDALKRGGFDFGERMNKLGTYNIAWRRVMRNKGYKSLLELKPEDWKRVNLDAENLALAMSRPNNAAYQQGLLSVTTQFMAFTHKVALAMMGQNPAIQGKEVVRLWAGMFVLFGANMFGARDLTREHLTGMGFAELLDKELPGNPGGTVLDLLSAGLIQTTFNKVGNITLDDWKDIDTENFTPVLNMTQFVEMNIEGIIRNPAIGLMGPFGNRFSATLDAYEFARLTVVGMDAPPMDKLAMIMDMAAVEIFPQYSDISMSLLGFELQKMYHASGEPFLLQPTWNSLLARGLFGARSMEEMQFFRLNGKIRDSNAIVEDMIRSNRKFLTQYVRLYRKGEISRDMFHDAARLVGELAGFAPEGRVEEVKQGSMLPYFSDDDPSRLPMTILVEAALAGKLNAAESKDLINMLEPDEARRKQLHQWLDDAYNETVLNQEQLRRLTIEQNPNLRD